MKKNFIQAPPGPVNGTISLEGSKSISNRLLMMQAMCRERFEIINLSPSDDTVTLQRLLQSKEHELNVGAAGTTMRFLTSWLSISNGERILTGSERMKKRPIKILVDALRLLGADISYAGQEGFPPLRIRGKELKGGKLQIRADVSSQYISSLLMIAPLLEEGLQLELTGKISSFPYINMTLKTMGELGIEYEMKNNVIHVSHGAYKPRTMTAESDWSAASYYFSICALSKYSEIQILGLLPDSLQGDSVLIKLYEHFGVSSVFTGNELVLKHTGNYSPVIEWDFTDCPDIAQTVAVTAAALGVQVKMKGVESLKIKETDRTWALQTELKKFGVQFIEEGNTWILNGKAEQESNVSISTYEDHRMAMSFAPLSIATGGIFIEEPDVINKSYPSFWRDLSSLGFSVSEG